MTDISYQLATAILDKQSQITILILPDNIQIIQLLIESKFYFTISYIIFDNMKFGIIWYNSTDDHIFQIRPQIIINSQLFELLDNKLLNIFRCKDFY